MPLSSALTNGMTEAEWGGGTCLSHMVVDSVCLLLALATLLCVFTFHSS